ncbi:MAG: 30S ribosomal protein S4 [Clostridium sp.]
MARFNVPVLKRCRALGISPAYIGINKTSERKPKRTVKKATDYAIQLKEKQKAKFIYDVSEKQFKNYFEKASRKKGKTGEILLQILETRLDNVLFRAGFAKTRPQARQLISHGSIEVNGVKTDIASYLVKQGDIIKVRENKKEHPVILGNIADGTIARVVEWLEVTKEELSIKVLRTPEREEIDLPIEEHLIVELYSK